MTEDPPGPVVITGTAVRTTVHLLFGYDRLEFDSDDGWTVATCEQLIVTTRYDSDEEDAEPVEVVQIPLSSVAWMTSSRKPEDA